MIRSVLVANRGEIARRVFHTCRQLGIATVAVHSDADADAPFVDDADRAVLLPGNAPSETYLRGDLIVEAAQKAGADAIHPGYGFLSENADFARQVIAAGLTWIGPDPETIEQMGSKIRAKELMRAAGVPILEVDPDTAKPDDFPLLVKASAGGGGRGMRVVDDPADLAAELTGAAAEAKSAFGDDTVFVEPYLRTARHVEVQVLADTHGTTWILGDRDCSIQRRHQKVVEEAPAPGLSDATRAALHDAARKAAEAVGYVGAGTVEFLVDGERVFFLEMNTRLQVEHPVTEEVFGLDLVAHQIEVAEGAALDPDATWEPTGHAVEVRLYAEDPSEDWAPQTGEIRYFEIDDDVRVDSGVESWSTVSVHYDAMIAKVVAHGRDRSTAIRKLDDALRRAHVHGITTNLDLLRAVLDSEEFVAGRMHTALLEERLADWTANDPSTDRVYAIAAAVGQASRVAYEATVQPGVPTGFRNVVSQPHVRRYRRGSGEPIEVQYVTRRGAFEIDGVAVVYAAPALVVLEVDGVRREYKVSEYTDSDDVDVRCADGSRSFTLVPRFVDPADAVAAGSLLAPMPAAVVSVAVVEGQQVAAGDVVVVIEAMKMQHTITAPTDGVVTQLGVIEGAQVESGAVLAVIEGEEA